LYQCVEFLKSELVKLPQEKWPKTRSDLIQFAKREYTYSWELIFIVNFLVHAKILKIDKNGTFKWNTEIIKNYKFEDVAPVMTESLKTLFKKSSPKNIEPVQISSVEKVIAWLKVNSENLKEYDSKSKLEKLLSQISRVKIDVTPQIIVEELEFQEVVKYSKKNKDLVEYDLDLLLVEKKGYCFYILGFLLVGLLYSAVFTSIFS